MGIKKNIKKIDKELFLCDICGVKKDGEIFFVFDENWNKQEGLQQCSECFKKTCANLLN